MYRIMDYVKSGMLLKLKSYIDYQQVLTGTCRKTLNSGALALFSEHSARLYNRAIQKCGKGSFRMLS